jgi:glycerol-3-phosphate dehydrogenase
MTESVDVLVVGGGIHGVGCAQAAAAAGYSVKLLEETALAYGSSSRSSKLIHGGLRYLESWQWRLVRESLHERTTLLRIAPELVHLRRFLIPLYRQTRRQAWQLGLGLSLYRALAGFDSSADFGRVPRDSWTELDGLKTHDLRAVFWYHDAQTNDLLLTEAVMRSAASLGAELHLPARFVGAELHEDGVAANYRENGRERQCLARVLVNAAGPWAAHVARTVTPLIPVPALELVQGTHIIIDKPASERLYYVESPRDGRAIFFLPWQGNTMVGTTEVRFRGNPAAVQATPHEVNYLQSVVRHYFPPAAGAQPHIVDKFAGLRVLPAATGHAFHRSRETMLMPDRSGKPRVLSIYGGKLTTYRAVAQRVQNLISASLPTRKPRAQTDQLLLSPA